MTKAEQITQIIINTMFEELMLDMVAEQSYTRAELFTKLARIELLVEELLK